MCRELEIGVSAQQKLAKLLEVIRLLGFESLCVFGDSFDEVALLDPQSFPGAIKQFAKEVWPDYGTGRTPDAPNPWLLASPVNRGWNSALQHQT